MTVGELKSEIINWKFTRHRAVNLTIGIITLLLLEFVARPYYRPFIYAHNIYDLHIADTLGNSLGLIAAVFLVIGLIGQGNKQHEFLIKMTTISFVVYEIAQPLLGKPIDPWDIVATILSGGFCFLLYRLLYQKKQSKVGV